MRRPSKAVRFVTVASLLAAALIARPAGAEAAGSTDPGWQELDRHPGNGEQCLVCSLPIEGETAVAIRYKGRVFFVKESMLDDFRADPDAYFHKMQARSGLFDEAAMEGRPMRRGWLFAGLYVAAGLVFGALCASMALARSRRVLPWFFAGLAANVLALAVLLLRGQPAGAQAAPGGFGKVPTTRSPRRCPHCGASNHPAAATCSACGGALEPVVQAETGLLGARESTEGSAG